MAEPHAAVLGGEDEVGVDRRVAALASPPAAPPPSRRAGRGRGRISALFGTVVHVSGWLDAERDRPQLAAVDPQQPGGVASAGADARHQDQVGQRDAARRAGSRFQGTGTASPRGTTGYQN